MIEEINHRAFGLIDLLEVITDKSIVEGFEDYKRSIDAMGIEPLPERIHLPIITNIKSYHSDLYGNKISMYTEIDNQKVGLPVEKFKALIELANILMNDRFIEKYVNYEYIEKYIFDWIIDAYKEKRVKVNLIDFIYDSISADIKEYNYYFKATSLYIDEPIIIGDVIIDRITEDFLNEELIKFLAIRPDNTKEEFDKAFDYFRNKVVFIVKVKGVNNRVEKIAREKAILAANTLKLFFHSESLNMHFQLFSIDFENNERKSYYYMYNTTSEEFDYVIQAGLFNSGANPIILSKTKIEEIDSLGLEHFYKLLTLENDTELSLIAKEAINKLGDALSTRNLHERIVKIISFFEGVIVPSTNRKAKGETNLKKHILEKIPGALRDIDKYNVSIRACYEIRDKYLHNRNELHVNLDQLADVQAIAHSFLNELVILTLSLSTLEDFYKNYGIPVV